MKETVYETFSAAETHALGKKIGETARPGDVYTLVGDLGVGKTVFTQGIADGLGITEPVSSPTFTIVQVYEEGRMPFYHFDVYRIGDIEEMDEIGYEDYFYGYMASHTGYLRYFDLKSYDEGFVLELPERNRPDEN